MTSDKIDLSSIENPNSNEETNRKFVNKYLSTAAHYLNRTKSFHVSTTKSNEKNEKKRSSIDFPRDSLIKNEIRTMTNNDPSNSFDLPSNDSQGFVNTLRRSLRKSKERFYNKRSSTMKSCHSLHNQEQINDNLMSTTIDIRENFSTKSCSTTPKILTMPPLHPVLINGRDPTRSRSIQNGVLSQSQNFQLTGASSVHCLERNSSIEENSPNPEKIDDEKEKLRNELSLLKIELQKSKDFIAKLQKSEEQMRSRLAEQAQRQLEKGGKFEDLNQISRPTELIRSFNNLYSQSRIDALDALDSIVEMSSAEDLKSKLLFSVVVLAFRHSQIHSKEIRTRIRQILQLSNDKSSIILEETIEKYLRSTIQKFDVTKLATEVENQLFSTLYDYPTLKNCNELLKYINNACRTAWGLVNQTPGYLIEFQANKYDKQIHDRFHTSDNDSDTIIEYVWPCLIDGRDRTCVAKGVVITDQRLAS